MKKYVRTLLLIMIALGLSGCQNEASTPNACVPSVMYNGDIYCTTGKQLPGEVEIRNLKAISLRWHGGLIH